MKPSKRMTELEEAFWTFNSRYFRFGKKKLETLLGVAWADLDKQKALGVNRSYRTLYSPKGVPKTDTYRILINKDYKNARCIWLGTLLHEMCHFKLQGIDKSRKSCRSRLFQKEMKRLANMGAFNGIW